MPFSAVTVADRVEFGGLGFWRSFDTEITPWLDQAKSGITEYLNTQQTTDAEIQQLIHQRPRKPPLAILGPVGFWPRESAGWVIDIMFWVLSKLKAAENLSQATRMLRRTFVLAQQAFLSEVSMSFPRFYPDMGFPSIQRASVVGKCISIAPNGAMEIELNSGRVIFEKAGANGQTVAQYRATDSQKPKSIWGRFKQYF